jgi:hypothetical protein
MINRVVKRSHFQISFKKKKNCEKSIIFLLNIWNNYPDFFFIIAQIINVEETNILSRINEQTAKKTHHHVYIADNI